MRADSRHHETMMERTTMWGSLRLAPIMASDDAFQDDNCVMSIGYNSSLRQQVREVGGSLPKVGVATVE